MSAYRRRTARSASPGARRVMVAHLAPSDTPSLGDVCGGPRDDEVGKFARCA
jgi:hypothetical protein